MPVTFSQCSVVESDLLIERLAQCFRMQDGWEMRIGSAGGTWEAPSKAAISVIWAATLSLSPSERERAIPSPHGDGYMNLEWNVGSRWWSAEVWPDRIEYFINDDSYEKEWIGSLDSEELSSFLKSR